MKTNRLSKEYKNKMIHFLEFAEKNFLTNMGFLAFFIYFTCLEDGVHHFDMALAILCESQRLENGLTWSFTLPMFPYFFPQNEKVSHDILGFWNIINRLQTSFFKPSKLSTILST